MWYSSRNWEGTSNHQAHYPKESSANKRSARDMHRFWSFYSDSTCSGAPTGVFVQRLNDCVAQVASNGDHCVAKYDESNTLVGYVDESCHEGRAAGFDALFDSEPYMAYDYYNDYPCEDYENSVAYRASGDCEALSDGYTPFRSATISFTSSSMVWTRNMGETSSALGCPGAGAPGYYKFEVLTTDIGNENGCQKFVGMGGGFLFYEAAASTSTASSSSNAVSLTSGSGVENSSPTSAPVESNSSSGSSFTSAGNGLLVGIIAGVAVLMVLVIAVVCCIWKRSKRRGDTPSSRSLEDPFIPRASGWTGGTTDSSEPPTLGPGLWNDPAIVATRVPRDQVVVQDIIFRGGYGEVFRGTYNHKEVAVKMLFSDTKSDLQKVNGLLAEAKLMAGLNHPHIVGLVGVAWGSLTELCVLSELMKGGDLRTLLKDLNDHAHPQGFSYDKIRIAYEVAQALTYLHSLSPIVIHRDLKSRNVLLTEELEAKLTDFGVSREREEVTMTAGIGTMLWMAPEVMMADRYTEKADIFSFGVLLSELDSQLLPYYHAKYDSVTGMKMPDAVMLQKVASGTLQVEFSDQCLPELAQLGKECVELDPSTRPSAPMVVFRLQTIMREFFKN